MNADVPVLSLQPVAENWLGRMIAPAAAACQFKKIPAINVMQLRDEDRALGGSFYTENNTPTHSINLSLRTTLSSKTGITLIYLHECSHLVLCNAVQKAGQKMHAHGPSFLLVNMALVKRVDDSGIMNGRLFHSLKLYDFQDCPPFLEELEEHEWRSLILSFALKNYKHLAESAFSAEEIGEEARRLWSEVDGLAMYNYKTERDRAIEKYEFAQEQLTAKENALIYAKNNALQRLSLTTCISLMAFSGLACSYLLLILSR